MVGAAEGRDGLFAKRRVWVRWNCAVRIAPCSTKVSHGRWRRNWPGFGHRLSGKGGLTVEKEEQDHGLAGASVVVKPPVVNRVQVNSPTSESRSSHVNICVIRHCLSDYDTFLLEYLELDRLGKHFDIMSPLMKHL